MTILAASVEHGTAPTATSPDCQDGPDGTHNPPAQVGVGADSRASAPAHPAAGCRQQLLVPSGAEVYHTRDGDDLPFPDESFDLVTSRHPVRPGWTEIYRVLVPVGTYFAQHVGPASAFELIEFLFGPLPEHRRVGIPHTSQPARRTPASGSPT